MRILVVHQYYLSKDDPGGSRWNQFARYWAGRGHEVSVLCGMVHYATGKKSPAYKGRFLVREEEAPGITVYRCHVSQSYNRSFLGRFWAYLSFALSSTLAGMFCARRPDVIIATSPPLTVAITMWLLSVWHGCPAVFEVRDLWPESAIDTGVLASGPLIALSYRLEQLAYRRARWINVLTPAFVQALVARKGVPRSRISMIPNGADLDLLAPGPRLNHVRRRLGLNGEFVVSYFGAHGRANRLGQLLDVAQRIRASHPDVRFLLVGDGMEKPALVADARRRGLDNVLFCDPVPKDQVADFINASDVCAAVLMRNDTFKTVYPNKVFDYMSCQRPIIVAIDGVARELIEDSQAGLYARPEDPDSFIAALDALRNDPQRMARMGQNGYRHAAAHYDRQVLADQYLRLLETVVSSQ